MTRWQCVRLFSPALAFGLYALVTAFGLSGSAPRAVFLSIGAFSLAVAQVENIRFWRNYRRNGGEGEPPCG